MKNRILILLMACTCMCALSVAGATKHGKVSKTETTVRSMDMSFGSYAVVTSEEVIAPAINTYMSVNTKSIAIGVTAKTSKQKFVSEYKRWYSSGQNATDYNRQKYLFYSCWNKLHLKHADV